MHVEEGGHSVSVQAQQCKGRGQLDGAKISRVKKPKSSSPHVAKFRLPFGAQGKVLQAKCFRLEKVYVKPYEKLCTSQNSFAMK